MRYADPRLGGPLVWLHCDSAGRLEKLVALSEAVLQARMVPALCSAIPRTAPRRWKCHAACACPARMMAARWPARFCRGRVSPLRFWPRAGLPALVMQLERQGTRVLVAEMPTPRAERGLVKLPGHTRRVLNRLTHVYLRPSSGARPGAAPGCHRFAHIGHRHLVAGAAGVALQRGRARVAGRSVAPSHRLAGRGCPDRGRGDVIAVQRDALRESHRLALILHPADPMRGPDLYARFAQDFTMALRSRDDPITPETQVYIADTEGERGLWYRLAVACYMGGSPSRGQHLFPAGSGGPGLCHRARAGRRAVRRCRSTCCRAEGNTRRVTRPARWAMMRACCARTGGEMAHRGWQIVSEGAEATETLVTACWPLIGSDPMQPPGFWFRPRSGWPPAGPFGRALCCRPRGAWPARRLPPMCR